MKLYSNTITERDLWHAAAEVLRNDNQVIYLEDVRPFKPRKTWTNGVKFFATGNSPHATGHRAIGSYPLDHVERAATWSAYGYLIARLYLIDPSAKIGYYTSKGDFIAQCKSMWEHRQQYRRETIDFLNLLS